MLDTYLTVGVAKPPRVVSSPQKEKMIDMYINSEEHPRVNSVSAYRGMYVTSSTGVLSVHPRYVDARIEFDAEEYAPKIVTPNRYNIHRVSA